MNLGLKEIRGGRVERLGRWLLQPLLPFCFPMASIPKDKTLDATWAFLKEGYRFVGNRCERHASDVFETRLMLRRATFVSGEDAARMFYTPDRFTRRGAIPPTALLSLQDRGSVNTLDGESHRRRKQMFMSLMSPTGIQGLCTLAKEELAARLDDWETQPQVVLHREMEAILCAAACRWCGLSPSEETLARRTKEFSAMIEGAGAVGPRNWRGLMLRSRTERWARQLIESIRTGRLLVPETSAAYAIAMHRDSDGKLLPHATAAVELINVLRPIVAVARYITFAALALFQHPECRARISAGDEPYLEHFVEEVRRFYPFFPVVGGRALVDFEWRGHRFAAGSWVLLDLYGTNHDPRVWDSPELFQPNRFGSGGDRKFSFIPQGGGDVHTAHRCPGEAITVGLVKMATRALVQHMTYEVPEQDLSVPLSRFPTLPRSGFIIANVRRVQS